MSSIVAAPNDTSIAKPLCNSQTALKTKAAFLEHPREAMDRASKQKVMDWLADSSDEDADDPATPDAALDTIRRCLGSSEEDTEQHGLAREPQGRRTGPCRRPAARGVGETSTTHRVTSKAGPLSRHEERHLVCRCLDGAAK